MTIDDVKVVVGQDALREFIQDFLGVPRETDQEQFRREIRERAIERGMTLQAAAELAERVGKSSDTWPSSLLIHFWYNEDIIESTFALLCHLGLVPIDSPLLTDATREKLTKPLREDDRNKYDAEREAVGFAEKLGGYYETPRGMTDEEVDQLRERILDLPAALGPVVISADSDYRCTLYSLLGLSKLPIPRTHYALRDYGQKLAPEPDAPASGVDHLRRGLWRLADDPTKTAAELHVHVESTLARLLDLPEYFQHSIANWTYRFTDAARAFLIAMKAIDASSPLSGGPSFVEKTRAPFVLHHDGRRIAHAVVFDADIARPIPFEQIEEAEKRVYREVPALVYPILLHLSYEEAACVIRALGFADIEYPPYKERKAASEP